jgi:hypothetical protein
MKKKMSMLIILILALIAVFGSPIAASAAAITTTTHLEDVVEEVSVAFSCMGRMDATLVYDATIHQTVNKKLVQSFLLMNGTAYVVPQDPQYPPFVGEFTEIRNFIGLEDQQVQVWVINQTDDNLAFHITYFFKVVEGEVDLLNFQIACGN